MEKGLRNQASTGMVWHGMAGGAMTGVDLHSANHPAMTELPGTSQAQPQGTLVQPTPSRITSALHVLVINFVSALPYSLPDSNTCFDLLSTRLTIATMPPAPQTWIVSNPSPAIARNAALRKEPKADRPQTEQIQGSAQAGHRSLTHDPAKR